jgi:hypothetical protein
MHTLSRFTALALVFFLALTFAIETASADITRRCQAGLDVWVANGGPTDATRLGSIEGQGSCSGTLTANTCRERAKGAILNCLDDLWSQKQVDAIPARCKNLFSGSSRSGAELTYDGILIIDEPNRLTARAARFACCQARPNASFIRLGFGAVLTGDAKCAKTKVGNNRYQEDVNLGTYNMNCDVWRAGGICD